jgi:hypothetical protein
MGIFRLLCFSALCAFQCVFAQSTDASLGGTVLDGTGATVPAASVVVTNSKTGVASRGLTNDSGSFLFPALQPGLYRVEVEKTGFRKAALTGVRLDVGARVTVEPKLEVGTVADTVEVNAEADAVLGTVSSSIGGLVDQRKVTDLPLTSRNALEFTTLQAGTSGGNFAGSRIGNLNVQMDGVNVMDARINLGVNSTIFASTDRVQEFRVVTQPVDAELGRGSGQVQLITRSGTNEFHGSLFNYHRNTVLNANNWFNNQRGRDAVTGEEVSPRESLIRNQYGARLGGPIRKNKTFFHALYEGQRIRSKNTVNQVVLTDAARAGTFRFFPGVQNGNTLAARPVVDSRGNPVQPAGATGPLQSVTILGLDPNRSRIDPTGNVKKMLDLAPSPNNYLLGDGLNTAGFAWNRPEAFNQWQLALKFDHVINDRHRLAFSYNEERSTEANGFMPQPFPNSPGGNVVQKDTLYSATLTSVLSPRVVNEFRAGVLRPLFRFNAPWEVTSGTLPTSGSTPYLIDFLTIADPYNIGNDPQGRISPNYQYFNKTSMTLGKHNVKFGGQLWFVSSNGFNSFTVMPRSVIGQGGLAYAGVPAITGIGANLTLAQNILANLSGTNANVQQALNSPGGANPSFLAGEVKQRLWRAPEIGIFFQDDWKVNKDLTVNLGVRYEYYGVPSDRNGRTAGLVGGSAGLFGISGRDFGALFRPGLAEGSLSQVELVGPNSANTGRRLYNRDWNNFSPAVGVAWNLPSWMGGGKSVLRAGYSWAYERFSLRILDVVAGDQPGLRELVTRTSAQLLNQQNLDLPLRALSVPLATVPFTDRTQTLRGYDTGLRTPYVQNFNIGLERQLPWNSSFSVRYVGSKGTRLIRGANLNEQNIYENGILEAFRQVQAGQDSPLLNRLFNGLTVGGRTVDGVNWTGTQAVTAATQTQAFFAANNVGGFANYLNTTDNFVGTRGGLLSRAGLPQNWIVVNPQFVGSNFTSNYGSSTYHSMQVEFLKRMSSWTFQGNYTFAKAIGEEEGAGQEQLDSYRTLRNRSLDKRLMSFSIHHITRTNVIYELPFGKNRKFFSGAPGWMDRVIGGWQVGSIFNVLSGTPLALTSDTNTVNNFGDNTPFVTGPVDKQLGQAVRTGNGVTYFDGLTSTPDPRISNLQSATLRNLSTLRVMRTGGANGTVLFGNPEPGVLGNLAPRLLYGPGRFRFDANLVKRIRISERFQFEINAQVENLTNTPQWDDPVAADRNINSLNFGRITTATGARIIVIGSRINF